MAASTFQHTAARRRLRLAGARAGCVVGFNTQPPEGGCKQGAVSAQVMRCFNTQPPEGGCRPVPVRHCAQIVSTHSRPKAAATVALTSTARWGGFNTQPPEGGCLTAAEKALRLAVSTHSRPKAAARGQIKAVHQRAVSTHSRPKAAARSGRGSFRNCTVSTHSRPKAAAFSRW